MKLIFILGILLFPLLVSANRGGNGGGGWVCRDNDKKIRWVEILDLYEAQHLFGLKLRTFKVPAKDIVEQMKRRITAAIAGAQYIGSIDSLNLLKENPPKILYTNSPIPVVEDALYLVMPKEETCLSGTMTYEQIVNYHDNGTILVQRQLYNSLSEVSKAALIFHEGFYASSHLPRWPWQEVSSFEARRKVGLIFSDLSDRKLDNYFWGQYDHALEYGDYILNMQRIDSRGFLVPFSSQKLAIEISTDTGTDLRKMEFKGFFAQTDDRGIAGIKIPKSLDGKLITVSRIVTWIEGQKYVDWHLMLNHAGELFEENPGDALNHPPKDFSETPYWCHAFFQKLPTSSQPGVIDITCAKNPGSSPISVNPPIEGVGLKCTLADNSGVLAITADTEGTLAGNWCGSGEGSCSASYQYDVTLKNLEGWEARFDDDLIETCKILKVNPSKVAAAVEYGFFNPAIAGSSLYVLLDDNMTNLGAVYFQYRPEIGHYSTACKKLDSFPVASEASF